MEELVGYSLSPQQKRLWRLQKQVKRLTAQVCLLVEGKLDASLLKQAVGRVVERHAVLKTTYPYASGFELPVLVLSDKAAFDFAETSLHSLEGLEEFMREAARQADFDFQHGPLLRASLCAMPDERHLLVLTLPSLCADTLSLGALAAEVARVYQHLSTGDAELDDALQYLQFSEWQNQLLEFEEAADGLRYWQSQRVAPAEVSPLTLDKDPEHRREFVPAFFNFELDAGQVQQMRAAVGASGGTVEHFLGACWQTVLWRLNRKQPLTTGHVESFRDFDELRGTLGLLSRCLPVSSVLSEQASFAECLQAYARQLEQHDEHKAFYLAEDVLPEDVPHGALPYAFEYAEMAGVVESGGPRFVVLAQHSITEPHKLKLICLAHPGGISCALQYNSNAFDDESVEFIAHAFRSVVAQCSAEPAGLPGELNLLDAFYTNRLLQTFTDTARTFPDGHKTITELFEEQAAHYPDHTALVCAGRRLTYHELNARASGLAAYLRNELAVGRGDRLGLMCRENELLIVGMLGILKAGAAFVPLDPGNPAERVKLILDDSRLKALLNETCFQDKTTEYAGRLVWLDATALDAQPPADFVSDRTPDDTAYIIFTSGTTGRPKGTLIRDASLVNYVCWLRDVFALTAADSSALLSSYAFDLGYTSIWGTLLSGGSLHLISDDMLKEPAALVDYLVEHRVSFVKCTPSLFHVVAQAANVERLSGSALRLVLLGGEQIRVDDLAQFVNVKPDVTLVNHYGPTETTIGTVAHRIDKAQLAAYARHPVIGKPISNSAVYILDEHGRPVAPTLEGELCVSGVGLARGYLDHEELTREKFVEHPFVAGAKLYRTGDVAAWMPDGTIMFAGRRDDQVKIRGYRVELEEVRHALMRYELIKDAAVVARDSEAYGKELVAYIVAAEDIRLEDLSSFLAGALSEYMMPSYFVRLEALPLTANGKLDRNALPDLRDEAMSAGQPYVAPATGREKQLAALWEQVLGRARVGARDNFFDLGGHSLKAIQLATKLHKELNVKLDLGVIFAHPTVEELARVIDVQERSEFSEIEALPAREFYDVSHAQQRLLVLSQFDEGSVAYNVPGACVIEGALDAPAFRRAFDTLIERHENLRTVFVEIGGQPKQKIVSPEACGFVLEMKDLRSNPEAGALVEELVRRQSAEAFDLARGPLLRASLLRTGDEGYVFVFNIHHLISDGWSRGILISEVLTLYNAYARGRENPLAPLRLQYKDYAAWHNTSFVSQGAYWERVYENGVPVMDFPLDHERPRVLSFSGEQLQRSLSAGLTAALRKLAGEEGLTLNSLFLSLYSILLSAYTRQEDLVIGSLVSGRSHHELENLIGIFINFLPVRMSPQAELPLREFLRASNRNLVEAYENQDYPFDLLVDRFILQRDISRNPFFDTMLNFHSEEDIEGRVQFKDGRLPGSGISIRPYPVESASTPLDFKIDVRSGAVNLELYLDYNRNLFERRSMEEMLEKFILLLERVVENPTRRVADYALLTSEELDALDAKLAANNKLRTAPEIRVNVCASFVVEPVEEYLRYWGEEFEMNLEISFAPYNQVFQQLLDAGGIMHRRGSLNVLFLRLEDWLRDLKERDTAAQTAHLEKTADELMSVLRETSESGFPPCMVGIVEASRDESLSPEVVAAVERLNASLRKFVERLRGFDLLDLSNMVDLYAVEEVFDSHADAVGHMPFTPEYYAALGTYLARRIHARNAPPFKVIAVDCDNTLWKGVCGEAGADGVVVDEDCAALQRFLLKKYDEGFLLALCSKNNEEDVWEVFDKRPDMLVRREHFIAHRLNWQAKSGNLAALAVELNVGLDSFIFIDDSPFEIEEVSNVHTGLLGLSLPSEAGGWRDFLNHVWAFDRFGETGEDRRRNEMYRAEKLRREEQPRFAALEDFYKSLDIEIDIAPLAESTLDRAVQLAQRTNQFNLNGVRLTAEELRGRMHAPDALNWTIEVKDRFGEYGLVGLVLATHAPERLIVESFMLSCRVLGRGVEDAVLAELRKHCRARGASALEALYEPTPKNKPFSEFLERTGWATDTRAGSRILAVDSIGASANYRRAGQ